MGSYTAGSEDTDMAKREPAARQIVDISALKALTRRERIEFLTGLLNGNHAPARGQKSRQSKVGKPEKKH